MRNVTLLGALALAAMQTAASAQTMNVQSLMKDGYTLAGIISSPAGGASIFLQKGNTLMFCYTTETPTSPTLATKYCKPVQ